MQSSIYEEQTAAGSSPTIGDTSSVRTAKAKNALHLENGVNLLFRMRKGPRPKLTSTGP